MQTSVTIVCPHIAQLPETAQTLLNLAKDQKVWVIDGEMGAGKTTLTKAICRLLGFEGNLSSPTFAIVNEYYAPSTRQTAYHFDCYRLKNEREAYDIGIEEYLDSGNYCFIEWAEKIENLLPDSYFHIRIEPENHDKRLITVSHEQKNSI